MTVAIYSQFWAFFNHTILNCVFVCHLNKYVTTWMILVGKIMVSHLKQFLVMENPG